MPAMRAVEVNVRKLEPMWMRVVMRCYSDATVPKRGASGILRWVVVLGLRIGGIAQLARAVALQAIGQGFESPYLQFNRNACRRRR